MGDCQTRQNTLYNHINLQKDITQEAMHYSIRIPSKSKLGLLRSFLHADNAYLDTQNTISQITNIYVMHRQQAQLQARTQATLEAMFNAIP